MGKMTVDDVLIQAQAELHEIHVRADLLRSVIEYLEKHDISTEGQEPQP